MRTIHADGWNKQFKDWVNSCRDANGNLNFTKKDLQKQLKNDERS
ncbi:hypothetical protein [Lysinibacillus sp. TE18511]